MSENKNSNKNKTNNDADATQTHVASLQQELEEQKDKFLRLQAEFINFRRRTEEEKARTFELATGKVLKEIVLVFDDFELALKNKENHEHFKKGMELIYAKLMTIAEDFGLERIKTVGEKFNPTEHEALLAETSERPEQEVLQELQAGYKIKNTVLRNAKVKVAKKE